LTEAANGPPSDSSRFQILSFDGGGMKGLFAAAVLAEVEAQLHVSIVDHFDLIAGTSTGGLIALALGAGLTPVEIVDFYMDRGPAIFGRPRGISRIWRAKHKADELRAALLEVFGDRRLGSSTRRLVIPAYSLDLNDVYVFKTRHHQRLTRDHTELMVDVAMATTAAPTFLPAFSLRNQRLVDGGVWANNPTLVAVAEARSMLGVRLEDMFVLSMGTTDEVGDLPKRLDHGGYAQWVTRAGGLLLKAQATGSFHAAEHLVGADRVVRVDSPVGAGIFRLDHLDASKIRGLAEARAGHVCPTVRPFTEHAAPPFVPIPPER
jgi:patatin-like phospholipase/acyl hydrolase